MHVYKETKAITGWGQRHKQGKALPPNIINNQLCTVTYTGLLLGLGATTFIQKKHKKRPSHRQGGQAGPLGSL